MRNRAAQLWPEMFQARALKACETSIVKTTTALNRLITLTFPDRLYHPNTTFSS
jgi:hypothetical protein